MNNFILGDWVRERKDIYKQNKAFEIISKYIDSDENVDVKNRVQAESKIVWQLWDEPKQKPNPGIRLVSRCLDSIDEFIWDDYKRILLSIETSREYINFPEFVYEKLKDRRSKFTVAAFSDLLRIGLLCQYGGIWVDATMLALRPLGDSYLLNLQGSGFSFQRSVLEDCQSRKKWRHYNPGYFSWNCASRVRWLSSFIVVGRDRSILTEILRILLLIWKYETKYPHYFTCHIIYDFLVGRGDFNGFASLSDVPVHYLGYHINDKFDDHYYEFLKNKHPLQKLNWRIASFSDDFSFLSYILSDSRNG